LQQTVVAGSSDGSLFFWDLRAPSHSFRNEQVDVGGKTGLGRCMATQPLFGQIAFGTGEGVTIVSGAASSKVYIFCFLFVFCCYLLVV
jgi:hypothetical protein